MFIRTIPLLLVVFLAGCSDPEQMLVNPEITTSTLEDGAIGIPYSGRVRATGGTGPYTWSLESVPAELSSWLKVDPATGVFSGTPMAKVSPALPFVARVTDSWSTPRTATRTLTLGVKGCVPGAQVICYNAANGQCLQSTLVCSADGSTGTCGGGNSTNSMDHCGATCGACSTETADVCTDGLCKCGTNDACSGSTATCCSSSCVDLQSDVSNCGECGNACTNTLGANAHVVCSSGQCGSVCDTDYMPCSSGCCSQAVGVSAGGSDSCVLLKNGAVECWGYNLHGKLGNNSTTESHIPVAVRDSSGSAYLSSATAVDASRDHTCALVNGGVQCWGKNEFGLLGNNSVTDSHIPVAVRDSSGSAYLSGVAAIATGPVHSCALMNNGGVQCWGQNLCGQLGDNTTTESHMPVAVRDSSGSAYLSGVTAVAAGDGHACALLNSGGVQCWGYNYRGKLGNNNTTNSSIPVAVVNSSGTPISGITAIAAGYNHTCALTTGGGVQCWGYNSNGQLGNNSTSDSYVPVAVVNSSGTPVSGVVAISADYLHTCALVSGGGVQCWGRNGHGELGNNSTTESHVPVSVVNSSGTPISGITAIAAGYNHTCAFTTGGGVQCWGYNSNGQLGNNSTTESHVPVAVAF